MIGSSASCRRPRLCPFAAAADDAPDKVSVPEDVPPAPLGGRRKSLPAAKCPAAAEPGQHGLDLVDAQGGAVAPAAAFDLAGVQEGVAQFMHVDLAAVVVVESGKGREEFGRGG